MTFLLTILLIAGMIAVTTVVFRDASRANPPLFCLRNFFLAGLMVFQFSSGLMAVLFYDTRNPYAIADPMPFAMLYTGMLLAFTLCFLLIYRSGFLADRVASIARFRQGAVGWTRLTVLALVLFVSGVLCRLVLSHVPYFGLFFVKFGASFLAISVGLAVWAWMPRMWNPLSLAITLAVTLGSMATLTMGTSGRRDVLGVLMIGAWAAFYSHWQYLSYKRLLMYLAAFGSMAAVVLGAYTSTRHLISTDKTTVSARVQALASADLKSGIVDLLTGQGAAEISMYFLATRPNQLPYDTLHSVRLIVALPIPRARWPGKPDALGITSVKEINDYGKPPGWNIGPGLIGHMGNDNPFLAFPLYTLMLAVLLRFGDRILAQNSNNPFVVLPLGAALGQWIGVARGELGAFLALAVVYTIAAWVLMRVIAAATNLFAPPPPADHAHDHDEWAHYGDAPLDDTHPTPLNEHSET